MIHEINLAVDLVFVEPFVVSLANDDLPHVLQAPPLTSYYIIGAGVITLVVLPFFLLPP